jgi:hypothetical protein
MLRVIATKNLKHGDGSTSFTKGQLYVSNYSTSLTENTMLINNQNQLHRLNLWFKHFRQV